MAEFNGDDGWRVLRELGIRDEMSAWLDVA